MKGRVWDGRSYYGGKGEWFRLHHIVVSYRMELPTEIAGFRDLRRITQRLCREGGIEGGCMVFHPWRESRDNVFDVVGPHFHVFGLSKWVKPGDEVVAYYDGVVFKRVEDFDATQREPFEYVLQHCGIAEGTHAIVWFGNLAYNKMPRGPLERAASVKKDPKPKICPYCGSDDTVYIETYDIPPPVPWGKVPDGF